MTYGISSRGFVVVAGVVFGPERYGRRHRQGNASASFITQFSDVRQHGNIAINLSGSEVEFPKQDELPRVVCLFSVGAIAIVGPDPDRAGSGVRVGVPHTAIDRRPRNANVLSTIQKVCCLYAELKLHTLTNIYAFLKRRIHVEPAGAAQGVIGLRSIAVPIDIRDHAPVRGRYRWSGKRTEVIFQERVCGGSDNLTAGQCNACFSVVPMLE